MHSYHASIFVPLEGAQKCPPQLDQVQFLNVRPIWQGSNVGTTPDDGVITCLFWNKCHSKTAGICGSRCEFVNKLGTSHPFFASHLSIGTYSTTRDSRDV